MIEMLILLAIIRYRDVEIPSFGRKHDPLDDCMQEYGGLDYEPPVRQRPELRVVK